jgi:hypothetical protein
MNLTELVQKLETQQVDKRDYVIPTQIIRMEGGMIVAPDTKGGLYTPNEVMHQHLALKLGIPANYYRKMQDLAPELLEKNVNEWLAKSAEDKGSLLRTFETPNGNIARGLLSDRYGMIDNYDVLFAALSAIRESGVDVEVREADVTDRRLYINIVAPNIEVEALDALRHYLRDSQVGYGIMTGLSITNSEVGFGSYEIRPRVVVKRCMNGLIVKEDAFRKVHLGAKMDSGQINWSEKTKAKNLELIMSQTGDAIRQFLSEGYLSGIVQKLTDASNQRLEQPVDTLHNVVREVAKTVTMSEDNKRNILDHFLRSGDVAASGVVQALTFESQKMDADNRFEMESIAFDLLPRIKNFDRPFVSGRN